MRISEYYNLGITQPSLDFVDVDVVGDVPVFIDPRALRLLDTEWGAESRSLLQNFFHTVLDAIRNERHELARQLLGVLREPNETHLGFSRHRAQGRGLGGALAHEVWEALSQSEAVASGLLENLEDASLLVEGIASDIVSDMATNVIREPLIRYTQAVCAHYGIPIETVDSGPLWQPHLHAWEHRYENLPVANHSRLLLVPKSIVRRTMDYDPGEYYRVYMLPYLETIEIAAGSELVHLLKDGRARVFKKDLEEKYGQGKRAVVQLSRQHPQVLASYRHSKDQWTQPPMHHAELAEVAGTEMPDWDSLLEAVTNIEPGPAGADAYEKAIERLLTALFSPSLMFPRRQTRINQGRKRIDITYMNTAGEGFFKWLSDNYFAPYILVECKNYNDDPANPELDQLIGRFSSRRGEVGLLICREFGDKDLFVERCRDAAKDNRGFIISLDDEDLKSLVAEAKHQDTPSQFFGVLSERFKRLVM
jgi:hypothetical protein